MEKENQMNTAKVFSAWADLKSSGTNAGREVGSFGTGEYHYVGDGYYEEYRHTLDSSESLYIAEVLA
jgi:hypothetical protein